jgi:phosphate transport system substrate-binding protein
LNPDVTFPDLPVNVVHRSDGSGTTNIFTCTFRRGREWKKAWRWYGRGWPADKLDVGKGVRVILRGGGNPEYHNGAMGYVELAYAKSTTFCTPR